MRDKYKQIRAKFTHQYESIRQEVEDLFTVYDTDPTTPLILQGLKFIVIDVTTENPFLQRILTQTFVGVGVLTEELSEEDRKGFTEALGVEIGERFFFAIDIVMNGMERRNLSKFLLAHEVGHILLGHVDGIARPLSEMCEREFEADFFASEIFGKDHIAKLAKFLMMSLAYRRGIDSCSEEQYLHGRLGVRQMRNRLYNASTNFSWA